MAFRQPRMKWIKKQRTSETKQPITNTSLPVKTCSCSLYHCIYVRPLSDQIYINLQVITYFASSILMYKVYSNCTYTYVHVHSCRYINTSEGDELYNDTRVQTYVYIYRVYFLSVIYMYRHFYYFVIIILFY